MKTFVRKNFAGSAILLRISFSGFAALVFLSGCGGNNSGSNSNPPPPSISVSVSPATASLSGSGVQSFTAAVSNDSSNAGVTWSIGSGAGALSASTVTGVTYTAPSTIGATTTVTLTATSKTDTTKTASAAITLNPPAAPPTITSVAASCVPASVQTGQTSQCTAAVTGTGAYSSTVAWSVSGVQGGNSTVGTISAAGLYTAPSAVPSTNPVTVTATSTEDATKSGSASITLSAATNPPTITSVAASCTPASVQTGQTSQCAATVTGTGAYSSTVAWSVSGVQGGNSTVGTISTAGLYTAPSAVPATNPVTVTATSTEDTTKSGSATVTITSAPSTVQISSLSETTGNPFDSLTITGSGFDSTATVNFSSSSGGFSVDIQPIFVSPTSLIVPVPVIRSGTTFFSGAVNVVVVQSSAQSSSVQLQIAAVPVAPPSVPGTVTLGLLEGELAVANQLSSEITSGPVSSDLTALIGTLNAIIPQIQAVVDGTASSANLGTTNGQPVIIGPTELGQMDQVSLALLQSLTNSAGVGASAVPAGLRNLVSGRAAITAQAATGTGCLSAQAVLESNFEVANSGGATASGVASNLLYFNQTISTSPAAYDLIINTLKLAPSAILIVTKTGAVVVASPLVVAAEIYEGIHTLVVASSYIQNPAPTGKDNVELLTTIIGNLSLGLAGDITTFAVGVSDLQRDLQNLPQGTPPNPQAAVCVSVLSQNFGTEALGVASSSQSVTVTSSGTAPVTISGAVVGGPNPAQSPDFTLVSDGCSGMTLPVGGTCTITDLFTPSVAQSEYAALGITGNFPASPIVISLSGNGSVVSSGVDSITPATLALNPPVIGGCAGGSGTATFSVQPATGVTWTASLQNFPYPPPPNGSLSPASGNGPGTVKVTVTYPPQVPDPGFTCSDTFSLFWGYNQFVVSFSDGNVLGSYVTFTTVTVD